MPSAFRDQKSLPEWIEPDYFRRLRPLRRIRRWAIWVALFITVSVMAFAFGPRTRFWFQSRPVSTAHAMFNERCEACHVESFQTAARLVSFSRDVRSVHDETCQACHAGAPHHAGQSGDPHCVACHTEHRGQPVLARVSDQDCTQCHANLSARTGQTYSITNAVTSFESNHPEFGGTGGAPSDPGTVRFNHKKHLELTVKNVQGIDKDLLTRATQCAFCHEPDGNGRYMKPINYESHCKTCHPLGVSITGGVPAAASTAAEAFRRTPALHKDPMLVRAELRERLVQMLSEYPALASSAPAAATERPIPGSSGSAPAGEDDAPWVRAQLDHNESLLFDGAGGCRYCHQVKTPRLRRQLPVYEPSHIPARWLTKSVFAHQPHRLLACTECHDVKKSEQARDVNLPTMDSCRQCHRPTAGARTDCAECHRYHGSEREAFRGVLTIADCNRRP